MVKMVLMRMRRRIRVHEVGARLGAPHGSGGAVVGAGSFLRRVERPQPPAFLRLRVPYLRRVTAPRPAPHAAVPHRSGGGAAVFSGQPLVGAGGAFLVVVVVVVGDGVVRVGFLDRSHAVETPESFFHGVNGYDADFGAFQWGKCTWFGSYIYGGQIIPQLLLRTPTCT